MSDETAELLSEEKPKEDPPKGIVAIDTTSGLMSFSNQMELGTAARLMIQMKFAPAHLVKEGLEAVMSAMVFCKQHNFPNSAMNYLAYIKGRIEAYSYLITAMAERHPEYGDKEEFFITEEGDKICVENKNLKTGVPWAHVTRIKKKNSTVWNEYFFSLDDAEQAGLLTKATKADSGWIKYTKDLLYHKSKNRALNANYSGTIKGVIYHESEAYDAREVGPTLAEKMNDEFLKDPVNERPL